MKNEAKSAEIPKISKIPLEFTQEPGADLVLSSQNLKSFLTGYFSTSYCYDYFLRHYEVGDSSRCFNSDSIDLISTDELTAENVMDDILSCITALFRAFYDEKSEDRLVCKKEIIDTIYAAIEKMDSNSLELFKKKVDLSKFDVQHQLFSALISGVLTSTGTNTQKQNILVLKIVQEFQKDFSLKFQKMQSINLPALIAICKAKLETVCNQKLPVYFLLPLYDAVYEPFNMVKSSIVEQQKELYSIFSNTREFIIAWISDLDLENDLTIFESLKQFCQIMTKTLHISLIDQHQNTIELQKKADALLTAIQNNICDFVACAVSKRSPAEIKKGEISQNLSKSDITKISVEKRKSYFDTLLAVFDTLPLSSSTHEAITNRLFGQLVALAATPSDYAAITRRVTTQAELDYLEKETKVASTDLTQAQVRIKALQPFFTTREVRITSPEFPKYTSVKSVTPPAITTQLTTTPTPEINLKESKESKDDGVVYRPTLTSAPDNSDPIEPRAFKTGESIFNQWKKTNIERSVLKDMTTPSQVIEQITNYLLKFIEQQKAEELEREEYYNTLEFSINTFFGEIANFSKQELNDTEQQHLIIQFLLKLFQHTDFNPEKLNKIILTAGITSNNPSLSHAFNQTKLKQIFDIFSKIAYLPTSKVESRLDDSLNLKKEIENSSLLQTDKMQLLRLLFRLCIIAPTIQKIQETKEEESKSLTERTRTNSESNIYGSICLQLIENNYSTAIVDQENNIFLNLINDCKARINNYLHSKNEFEKVETNTISKYQKDNSKIVNRKFTEACDVINYAIQVISLATPSDSSDDSFLEKFLLQLIEEYAKNTVVLLMLYESLSACPNQKVMKLWQSNFSSLCMVNQQPYTIKQINQLQSNLLPLFTKHKIRPRNIAPLLNSFFDLSERYRAFWTIIQLPESEAPSKGEKKQENSVLSNFQEFYVEYEREHPAPDQSKEWIDHAQTTLLEYIRTTLADSKESPTRQAKIRFAYEQLLLLYNHAINTQDQNSDQDYQTLFVDYAQLSSALLELLRSFKPEIITSVIAEMKTVTANSRRNFRYSETPFATLPEKLEQTIFFYDSLMLKTGSATSEIETKETETKEAKLSADEQVLADQLTVILTQSLQPYEDVNRFFDRIEKLPLSQELQQHLSRFHRLNLNNIIESNAYFNQLRDLIKLLIHDKSGNPQPWVKHAFQKININDPAIIRRYYPGLISSLQGKFFGSLQLASQQTLSGVDYQKLIKFTRTDTAQGYKVYHSPYSPETPTASQEQAMLKVTQDRTQKTLSIYFTENSYCYGYGYNAKGELQRIDLRGITQLNKDSKSISTAEAAFLKAIIIEQLGQDHLLSKNISFMAEKQNISGDSNHAPSRHLIFDVQHRISRELVIAKQKADSITVACLEELNQQITRCWFEWVSKDLSSQYESNDYFDLPIKEILVYVHDYLNRCSASMPSLTLLTTDIRTLCSKSPVFTADMSKRVPVYCKNKLATLSLLDQQKEVTIPGVSTSTASITERPVCDVYSRMQNINALHHLFYSDNCFLQAKFTDLLSSEQCYELLISAFSELKKPESERQLPLDGLLQLVNQFYTEVVNSSLASSPALQTRYTMISVEKQQKLDVLFRQHEVILTAKKAEKTSSRPITPSVSAFIETKPSKTDIIAFVQQHYQQLPIVERITMIAHLQQEHRDILALMTPVKKQLAQNLLDFYVDPNTLTCSTHVERRQEQAKIIITTILPRLPAEKQKEVKALLLNQKFYSITLRLIDSNATSIVATNRDLLAKTSLNKFEYDETVMLAFSPLSIPHIPHMIKHEEEQQDIPDVETKTAESTQPKSTITLNNAGLRTKLEQLTTQYHNRPELIHITNVLSHVDKEFARNIQVIEAFTCFFDALLSTTENAEDQIYKLLTSIAQLRKLACSLEPKERQLMPTLIDQLNKIQTLSRQHISERQGQYGISPDAKIANTQLHGFIKLLSQKSSTLDRSVLTLQLARWFQSESAKKETAATQDSVTRENQLLAQVATILVSPINGISDHSLFCLLETLLVYPEILLEESIRTKLTDQISKTKNNAILVNILQTSLAENTRPTSLAEKIRPQAIGSTIQKILTTSPSVTKAFEIRVEVLKHTIASDQSEYARVLSSNSVPEQTAETASNHAFHTTAETKREEKLETRAPTQSLVSHFVRTESTLAMYALFSECTNCEDIGRIFADEFSKYQDQDSKESSQAKKMEALATAAAYKLYEFTMTTTAAGKTTATTDAQSAWKTICDYISELSPRLKEGIDLQSINNKYRSLTVQVINDTVMVTSPAISKTTLTSQRRSLLFNSVSGSNSPKTESQNNNTPSIPLVSGVASSSNYSSYYASGSGYGSFWNSYSAPKAIVESGSNNKPGAVSTLGTSKG